MQYLITYNVILYDNVLYDKEIRVKNKDNELVAKCSLEDYLKRKYGNNFRQLVITNCREDISLSSDFINLFNMFK